MTRPRIHDQNRVGGLNRRKTMGDDDRGALRHQFVEGGADLLLADRVEMRGRFVQDQDRRVLEEGACNRDPLALAAGQLHAALAHPGGEAVGQTVDELAQRGAVRSPGAVRVGHLAPGEADVRRQRVVEQIRVLCDQRDDGRRKSSSRSWRRSMPPSVMRLAAGSQKRSSRLATVDLPAPEAPTSATVLPGRTSKLTPSNGRRVAAGIGEAHRFELQLAASRAPAGRRR